MRPHLDYGDIIHDQTYSGSFHRKHKSIQYSVRSGTIKGTSFESLNQELGLVTLQYKRWYRKLCLFYKIVSNQSPSYLFDYIPSTVRTYKNAANVSQMKSKHTFLKNSCIPSIIIEWNKLDQDVRNAESPALFRKHLISFIRLKANSIFNVHNAKGTKLLVILRNTNFDITSRCNKPLM